MEAVVMAKRRSIYKSGSVISAAFVRDPHGQLAGAHLANCSVRRHQQVKKIVSGRTGIWYRLCGCAKTTAEMSWLCQARTAVASRLRQAWQRICSYACLIKFPPLDIIHAINWCYFPEECGIFVICRSAKLVRCEIGLGGSSC